METTFETIRPLPQVPESFSVRSEFLPFSPPLVGEEEIQEVVATLRSSWITTGPKTKKFESEFAAYVGAQEALALNSCTAGLHTTLVTLGIGPGDEVITTPMTFVASVNVIEHVGARPILVDIEPDTQNIDPFQIEKAITKKTKAILAVHFAGHPVELDRVTELAERHKLSVVEDAAHAVAAKFRGRPIGSSGNPVAFSFYATKNLSTAEGGMLVGNSEFVEKSRIIALHGMSRDAWKRYGEGGKWWYDVVAPGFKYNMTDVQASLGLWQLAKLQRFQERRRQIVERYQAAFGESVFFEVPVERSYVEHAWHLYVLRLNLESLTLTRDQFIEELTRRKVGTSVHFIPVHRHSYYRNKYDYSPLDYPVAEKNYQRSLSLPLNLHLTDSDVDYVIGAVFDVAKKFQR